MSITNKYSYDFSYTKIMLLEHQEKNIKLFFPDTTGD